MISNSSSPIDFLRLLWPLCRSITGNGLYQSLLILKSFNPNLLISSYPSGTSVFDWSIPPEWNIYEAWIMDSSGQKIVDFADNNLHLVGYSR